MNIDFFRILISTINIAIILVVIYLILKGIRWFQSLMKLNKRIEEKLDILISKSEKK